MSQSVTNGEKKATKTTGVYLGYVSKIDILHMSQVSYYLFLMTLV